MYSGFCVFLKCAHVCSITTETNAKTQKLSNEFGRLQSPANGVKFLLADKKSMLFLHIPKFCHNFARVNIIIMNITATNKV